MVAGKAPPSYLQSPPSTSYRTTSSSSSQKATVVSSAALTCSSQDKDKFSAGGEICIVECGRLSALLDTALNDSKTLFRSFLLHVVM